jgi:glycerol-3-phosphate acyltransferase PlsX
MTDQKAGRVQAVVSAGSTGAMVAASLIVLGRLPGVDRPAIATIVPTASREVLLLDAGANVQCTPEQLVCFARMGTVFAREVMGTAQPTAGLINIGGEAKKGSELTVAAHALLASATDLTFHGNVEGNEIMLGPCDVLVTDGFTGNTVLKIIEGFGHFLGGVARRPDLEPAERQAFGPVLGYLQRSFSYEAYGGAMLLGVSGISIISHGRSSAAAMGNAVRVAWEQIHASLPEKTAAALA